MFEVKNQQFDKHVVVPDLHGEWKLLGCVVDEYHDNEDIGFVFLGDVIDRSGINSDQEQGVRRTLEIIRQLGERAIVCMANHEWHLLGSVLCKDPYIKEAIRTAWMDKIRRGVSMERNTFNSYELESCQSPIDPLRLWKEMSYYDHDKLLKNITPYYETDKFIATHAGLNPDTPWQSQKHELEMISLDMLQGIFNDTPPQWFSFSNANHPFANKYVAKKAVVSGHSHNLPADHKDRVTDNGKRVRLASHLNNPDRHPLHIWQDWDGEVIKISQKD